MVPVGRDPVEFWLSRVGVNSRPVYRDALRLFLQWLNARADWRGVDAKALLERHRAAKDQYELLDLLQEYLSGLDRSRRGKAIIYSSVRSFFMHNRSALPQDRSFKLHGSRPPSVPKLTLNHIIDVAKASNLRDRSIVLVKWQGLLDNERLAYVGKHASDQIVSQIREGVHPVRIDLPERKNNERPWHTFIGKDAVDALTAYFEQERGWPKKRKPIWLTIDKEPLTATAFKQLWMRLTRRVGLVPKRRGSIGTRYGFGAHEMRDVAKSLLHTNAKREGFDMDCAEFWLGHTVDAMGYDKFYNDQEYVRKQYLIAERYLNIISTPLTRESAEERERMDRMENELLELRGMLLERINLKKLGEPPAEETETRAAPASRSSLTGTEEQKD